MIEFAANVVAENTCEASVDVEIVETRPLVPVNANPCVSDGRKKLPDCVDDAVEK